jgi:hypothetical protein
LKRRGRPKGSFSVDRNRIYLWFRNELSVLGDQAASEMLLERARYRNLESAMLPLERKFALADKVRRTVPKADRSARDQERIDAYAAARERAGEGIFPDRPWSRLYHLQPRLSRESKRELVRRAAAEFNTSERTADRRWNEFKKLTPRDWERVEAETLLQAIRRAAAADADATGGGVTTHWPDALAKYRPKAHEAISSGDALSIVRITKRNVNIGASIRLEIGECWIVDDYWRRTLLDDGHAECLASQ